MLLLRLTLGWGLLLPGAGKIAKLNGSCLDDPMPTCEAQAEARCGDDRACADLGRARCVDDRAAACADAAAASVRFFAQLAPFGVDALTLPGGGRLNLALAGVVELLAGAALLLGLLARPAAIAAALTMLVAVTAAHADTFDARASFVNETAWLYFVLSLVVLAFGPGRLAIDHALAASRGAAARRPASPAGPKKKGTGRA